MAQPNYFVLWGSAGHARVLSEIIVSQGGRIIALFDNFEVTPALPSVPLYYGISGFNQWHDSRKKSIRVYGLVAIGGGRGRDRVAIQKLFRACDLELPVLVHNTAVVSPSAIVGEGSQLLALANVAANVQIGEACIINHRASVDHDCQLGDGVHIAPGVTLCGCIDIGDNVFIGAGAVVLPRLSIGSDSIVGAGAVVVRDVPAGTIVAGNPAQPTQNNTTEK
jgi:sugar O-acyltransferase (sialic acid O-acetyltransferase NeuD family)